MRVERPEQAQRGASRPQLSPPDHQALDSHRSPGPWCHKGCRPLPYSMYLLAPAPVLGMVYRVSRTPGRPARSWRDGPRGPLAAGTVQVGGCVAWMGPCSGADIRGRVKIYFGDRTRLVHILAMEIWGWGGKRAQDKPQGTTRNWEQPGLR